MTTEEKQQILETLAGGGDRETQRIAPASGAGLRTAY